MAKTANERTFQGELYRIIHNILNENTDILFEKVLQETQVGTGGQSRFSDGIIYSKKDKSKNVFIELKNSSWDATNETLIMDAAQKAFNQGVEYFVTGTPRQLVVFKTFVPNTKVTDRKLKIYTLSNIKYDDDVLLPSYEKIIYQPLKIFLKELSDLVHGIKEVHWDSIDRYYVYKLSAYILEASASMFVPMHERISEDADLRKSVREYLKEQDIFNVSVNFSYDDVYNLCQLSNYLLYLKIIFYSYLQRDVPALNLKVLEIPLDKKALNFALRERFNDVLKHDYELIFTENILEQFEFDNSYLPNLKRNVKEIEHLEFRDLNTDIIGAIYNTLIDNQEQHDRGQHFTNTHEVDIVNAFCIKPDTQFVIDTSAGAGTFLVRAYYFFKQYAKQKGEILTHETLLERLWGVEIAAFASFLGTMNLCLQDVSVFDNYPKIIHEDFADVTANFTYHGFHLNKVKGLKVSNVSGKKADVEIPVFDACVGNPPYIRQELIERKADWSKLALTEHNIKKVNQQSDLYVYYLMHTASLLKEGGRLGYVISSSWLDVSFGRDLQDFLLKNFKIVAILDNQSVLSFETALVNTVILIVEKCSNRENREQNTVRFVRVSNEYPKLIGNPSDEDRIERLQKIVHQIEDYDPAKKTVNESLFITNINQQALTEESTLDNKYQNGHWGAKYLRSPKIYQTLLEKVGDKFTLLCNICDVKYGIKTGANSFFYLEDHTHDAMQMLDNEYFLYFGKHKVQDHKVWEKHGWYYSELTKQHHIIEKFYVQPIFKSQREAKNLEVDMDKLNLVVLMCDRDKGLLHKTKAKVLDYINEAEKLGVHLGESVQSRLIWYDLSHSAVVGDFLFPSKIGERYRLIDNRNTNVFCDKVNYAITVKQDYKIHEDLIFLLLNCMSFRFLIDLFSRQMVVKISDVDVNVVERTLIPDPQYFSKEQIKQIIKAGNILKNREQLPIQEEIKQKDRLHFEFTLLQTLGFNELEINELLHQTAKYVQDRSDKSDSVITTKSKAKLNYDDSLKFIKERFPEVRNFMEQMSGKQTQKFTIPEWKAKFPKSESSGFLFDITYKVFFKQGNTQITLEFKNKPQLQLFEWLYNAIDLKGREIHLPIHEKDCVQILQNSQSDFDNYFIQIRNLLKSNRSTANPLNIYRDLLGL
jgi:type I restriction enzyme M protein